MFNVFNALIMKVQIMARLSGNARWAYDTYRRFLSMYGTVVLGVDKVTDSEVEHGDVNVNDDDDDPRKGTRT